jgi:hypothetical protein
VYEQELGQVTEVSARSTSAELDNGVESTYSLLDIFSLNDLQNTLMKSGQYVVELSIYDQWKVDICISILRIIRFIL